ncbi:hypothetical protein CARUB_v10009830mg [Capsella rubella]|uniref:Uncharacterized protein n=1 Tax=Capsella rubella TaxID=81985 RepID=R0I7L8_9BRAS|nr:UPF0725 protein At1g23950 [Capsella rubella]EOA38329.1 hypothetical protein CARUB_v10009830mg [Capsella rubella]
MEEEKNLTTEDFYTVQNEYWRQANESEGFDLENISLPSSGFVITGLLPIDCQKYYYPCRILMELYAKVGLYRYNMLEGTNFQFDSLIKFNISQTCFPSYYMTLFAQDPVACPSGKTFQVRVGDQHFRTLALVCSVARPKGEVTTETPFIPHFDGGAAADGIFKGELPDWPSDDALKDEKRFYLVKKSEWQATDWISMFLELVVCENDTSIAEDRKVVSKLEIVKVVVETATEDVELPIERLKTKNANVYIMFKGMAELQAHRRVFEIGVDVERKAIVRRVMDNSGDLFLTGKLCGGQPIKKRRRHPWL